VKAAETLDLTVVLPVYNEAGALPGVLRELAAVLTPSGLSYEILAVDDGSTDGSLALLLARQAADAHLRVIEFRRNFGQTAAFQAGFDLARGAVVVTMDADAQNDPADIPRLLAKLESGYDIVAGWRANRKEPFVLRRLPSMVANGMIARLTGVHLHDSGCSLKALRADVAKNIHLYGELHRFIPALASGMGVRIAELAVNHRSRVHGASKYNLSRTFRVLIDLITVYFLLSYAGQPMRLFGGAGMLALSAGVAIGGYLTVLKLALGASIGERPSLLLAILLVVLGLQLITTGLLAELIMRTYHETRRQPPYFIRRVVPDPAERAAPPRRTGRRA
jgi:glycosyltransferase involved in cell wall biosynthesis